VGSDEAVCGGGNKKYPAAIFYSPSPNTPTTAGDEGEWRTLRIRQLAEKQSTGLRKNENRDNFPIL